MGLELMIRGLAVWSILGLLAAGTATAQHHGGGHYGGGGGHHHHGGGGFYGGGGYYGGYRPGYGVGFGSGYYGSGFSLSIGRPYGYGYGGGYYGNSYRTPQYYYPTQAYVQPAPTYVQQAPVYTVPSAPISTGEVTILFPSDGFEAVIDYTLNGNSYTMRTGQAQRFANDRMWTIEFDRGGDFGTARYSLSPGTFKFKLTDRGWELVRAASSLPAPAP